MLFLWLLFFNFPLATRSTFIYESKVVAYSFNRPEISPREQDGAHTQIVVYWPLMLKSGAPELRLAQRFPEILQPALTLL